jgi:hypothetical protein
VITHETVFAAGDITNLPENRLAIMAGLDAKLIAAICEEGRGPLITIQNF